jgi:nitric oxide reductase NorD protein
MCPKAKKHIAYLEEGLRENLKLDFFDDWEIDAVFSDMNSLDPRLRQKTLALCFALSNASSSLVPNTLKRIKKASLHLSFHDMERWITSAFDLLDSRGIDPFLKFIATVDEASLSQFRGPEGLRLHEVSATLETYLRGISGMELKVAAGKESYTDTATVYLPTMLNFFGEFRKNFLLYKLMAVHKWAQISQGTLNPGRDTLKLFAPLSDSVRPDIEDLFGLFSRKELAVDLYNIIEAFRLESFLQRELPGLMKEADNIKKALLETRPALGSLPEKTAFVEGLCNCFLGGEAKEAGGEMLRIAVMRVRCIRQAHDAFGSIRLLFDLYDEAMHLKGEYKPQTPPIMIGCIKPEKVSRKLKDERDQNKKRLEGLVTNLINMSDSGLPKPPHAEAVTGERMPKPEGDYLVIKGRVIELDAEMKELLEEMTEIQGGILVKGSDIGTARRAILLKDDLVEEAAATEAQQHGGIKYDEWDYRRGGYKKDWCSLYEQDIHPGHEPFVEMTLKRYGGYVTILRKKFELLKREPKMLRRQRDGDDIDIDAAIEAFSDMKAGIPPNEDLFTRLDRQERNIAGLFLLDMSGSTKGWVNEAEKESLVLLCEALEALGDRYAIYGFSGITRTRCDFYTIKSFQDSYSDKVRKRIAGIHPKDYTRMGPPIRHSIRILESIEARTKLLITLSDGKPEDWDAYKGDYGIEDTQKALLEAKDQGIHPFCITFDNNSSSYLPHMYGESKYIVIDDVRKLPHRITEIYRMLTA